ncbi:uncharacterized protein LOC133438847 isoform X2 [Cololabis saira]|uniref:uncharacterized protein LOC133438847 isoform X2 n=1 Tax=Cololabis saira TaxID=129043 RepID=UPI002AD21DBC|nr:uncharacterized protein LOC133438847 isoform X2 [Cololabis saira]
MSTDLPADLLSHDDALAVESAVRAAVSTAVRLASDAYGRRLQEYQRMVADRDREIRRLETELEELRAERRERDPRGDGLVPRAGGLGAATPAKVSSECCVIDEIFPHQHPQTDRDLWGGQEPVSGYIPSMVKEEPCDADTVIKWEVCEGSLLDQMEGQHQRGDQPLKKDAECAVKNANPHLSKLLAPLHEDETAAHLRRKGGGRNGSYPPESEEEEGDEGVVKEPFIDHLPLKITRTKDTLGSVSSPEPLKLSSHGSVPNINVPDPLTCQQQALISMAASQPTCDPILLEVLVSLETIKQQNTTVLKILQSGNSSAVLHSEPPDVGALPLPLQSVQDLRTLENRLSSEPELKKKMISYLGLSGGMTTKESVWRIMAKLFTNTLAKNVNWRGRNNKQKIESLTIKKVVLNAVRQNSFCKNAVDEEIERYMKRWLQLAGDRDGGRKRRQEKGKEAMGDMMRNYCVGEMFAAVME